MKKILVVFGTRPEAIKCFPVIAALQRRELATVRVCVTAQHRDMLDQVLEVAGITPDIDLDLMRPGQTLSDVTSRAVELLSKVIEAEKPDWLLVQGDTTTAMSAALAAFYHRVPVGHIEAGLRSGDIYSPWPEEVNRRIVSTIAALHFAPTEGSRENLLRENVAADRILVTGNTVIDALLATMERLRSEATRARYLSKLPPLDDTKRLILATTHRREHFDGGLHRIFAAFATLARRGDVQIVLPLHPNPNVQRAASEVIGDAPNIRLIEPQQYVPFVWLMSRADLILTDSGGVQEEAPSLGVPVLVLRDTTERPEGIEAGNAKLVGSQTEAIIAAAEELLDNPAAGESMRRTRNPYGDGQAAERIAEALTQ